MCVHVCLHQRVLELLEQRSMDAHTELLDRALGARNDDGSIVIRHAAARLSVNALHVELNKE